MHESSHIPIWWMSDIPEDEVWGVFIFMAVMHIARTMCTWAESQPQFDGCQTILCSDFSVYVLICSVTIHAHMLRRKCIRIHTRTNACMHTPLYALYSWTTASQLQASTGRRQSSRGLTHKTPMEGTHRQPDFSSCIHTQNTHTHTLMIYEHIRHAHTHWWSMNT